MNEAVRRISQKMSRRQLF